jgi:hypothetical protein
MDKPRCLANTAECGCPTEAAPAKSLQAIVEHSIASADAAHMVLACFADAVLPIFERQAVIFSIAPECEQLYVCLHFVDRCCSTVIPITRKVQDHNFKASIIFLYT